MEIPQDLQSLLSLAIRDAIWFKENVAAFLKSCGLPQDIQRRAAVSLKTSQTVKVIPVVIGELQSLGAGGDLPLKRLFTNMCNWKDFTSLKTPEQRAQARESVATLKKAYEEYRAELEFQERKAREEWEAKTQSDRVDRTTIKQVNSATLQNLRDRFDAIYILTDEQERGTKFQDLMNELFKLYAMLSKGPFNRTGEQIDGHFYLDNHPYYVEVRWKRKKTNAADISVLRDRAKSGFGGDTKGLFIAFEGFSSDALENLAGKSEERVVLMDGGDIHAVLEGRIGLDVLLMEKQMDLSRGNRAFVSAYEIMTERATRI